MGKQINFYMDYESFILLAQKAIELGCEIIRDSSEGVKKGHSTDIVTNDNIWYYFHIPEAGKFKTKDQWGKECIDHGYSASGITLIEARYSTINNDNKYIIRARIYCITDYYDADGNRIKRSECVTKIYDSLARYVKKLAPYTEVEYHPANPNYEKVKRKIYITPKCLALVREQNYSLH